MDLLANVLCVQASPRKRGYSAKLLESAVEGMNSVDGVTVDLVNLVDYHPINPCKSCWSCVRGGYTCVHDDPMGRMGEGELFRKIRRANALFISHPVYYGRPTAGVQTFFERFYPFMWSGELDGMPFASISQAANNGGARTAQIDMKRWAVTFKLRVVGGLPVHMVTYDESLNLAKDLGRQVAREALVDVGDRRGVTSVERYLESYDGQWSRLESALMDLTNGSLLYEDSLIMYAIRNGSIKGDESNKMLRKAGEELRLSLECYADKDLRKAAEHLVKMSSYWSPATLREFLPDIG